MEQGPTFRISMPKYPTKDPHYRILAHQRRRTFRFRAIHAERDQTPRRAARDPENCVTNRCKSE